MKVYIIMESGPKSRYDEGCIVKVFRNKRLAQKFAEKDLFLHVQEWDVE